MLAILCFRFFAALVLAALPASAVEIIAHRGASADAPENSLSAMMLAWEQGADAIELDLRLSKDGKLIVFHDGDTKRIGGVDRKISDYTLEEAAKIDVGAWKGDRFKGEKLPSLESILATVPPLKRALLELKTGPEIVPELVRVVRASKLAPRQLAVISFQLPALAESKKQLPEVEHYFLHGYKKDAAGRLPELPPLLSQAKAAGFEGLNLQHGWPIDEAFVKTVKAAGLKLYVWTVNDLDVARRLAAAGVDGITTDHPLKVREAVRR